MSTLGKHWKLSEESKKHVKDAIDETFKNGRVVHNKGKTKENYMPLKEVSDKLKDYDRTLEHQKNLNKAYSTRKDNLVYKEKIRSSRMRQKIEPISEYEYVIAKELEKIKVPIIQQYPIRRKGFLTKVDIYHSIAKLCIYLDGDYWHKKERDEYVDKTLKEMNYRVLRISYGRYRDITPEIMKSHIDLILKTIKDVS